MPPFLSTVILVSRPFLNVADFANGEMLAVSRSLIELDLKPGMDLRGDSEVRLSGAGQRGMQATSRNCLFIPAKGEPCMVDDFPTEARMYPEYWGEIQVR